MIVAADYFHVDGLGTDDPRRHVITNGVDINDVPVKRRKGSGWIWVVLAVLVVLGLAAAAIYLGTKGTGRNPAGAPVFSHAALR